MKDIRKNVIVGIFVIIGLAGFVWMVFKFQDLPRFISSYDASVVSITFPEIPGIQENSAVSFKGYNVGKVVEVSAPTAVKDPDSAAKIKYIVNVKIAVGRQYTVPANVTPVIYRKGLGANYVNLILESPPIVEALSSKHHLYGKISEGNDFIPAHTQEKLDLLIVTLTDLSHSIQNQLVPITPKSIDNDVDGQLNANITTAIMRLDSVLKNFNLIIGDLENQRNAKTALAEFAALGKETRLMIEQIKELSGGVDSLIDKSTQTVDNIGNIARQIGVSVKQVAAKTQNAEDELIKSLKILQELLNKAGSGDGSVARALNDPRLYESLNDTAMNLSEAVRQLKFLIEQWKNDGVKMKIK